MQKLSFKQIFQTKKSLNVRNVQRVKYMAAVELYLTLGQISVTHNDKLKVKFGKYFKNHSNSDKFW